MYSLIDGTVTLHGDCPVVKNHDRQFSELVRPHRVAFCQNDFLVASTSLLISLGDRRFGFAIITNGGPPFH